MAVYIFDQNTPGAPTMTATAGSLITLLDFILVAQLGWTKPFSGTNKAVYRQPPGSNEFYLRVVDSGTAQSSSRARGYEAMTDIDTGTGPFPTVAQESGDGATFAKPVSAGGYRWYCVSDGKIFYLACSNSTSSSETVDTNVFGDFHSFVPGDQYNTVLVAPNYSYEVSGGYHYVARPYSQSGSAVACVRNNGYLYAGGSGTIGYGNVPYPDPATGGAALHPAFLDDIVGGYRAMRGYLPGWWMPLYRTYQAPAPAVGDTFSGGATMPGRQFIVKHGRNVARAVFETSDTWGL